MCKDIKLKEHHGEGRELYFVSRVEPLSFSPTTITNRICMEICFNSAMSVGLDEAIYKKECTY